MTSHLCPMSSWIHRISCINLWGQQRKLKAKQWRNLCVRKNHITEYKAVIMHHWKNHSWLYASWGCLRGPFPKQALSLSWMPKSWPSVTNTYKNAAGTTVTCGWHSHIWGSVGHWKGKRESLHAWVPALLNPHSPRTSLKGRNVSEVLWNLSCSLSCLQFSSLTFTRWLQFSSLPAKEGSQNPPAPRQHCKNKCINSWIRHKSKERLDEYEQLLHIRFLMLHPQSDQVTWLYLSATHADISGEQSKQPSLNNLKTWVERPALATLWLCCHFSLSASPRFQECTHSDSWRSKQIEIPREIKALGHTFICSHKNTILAWIVYYPDNLQV